MRERFSSSAAHPNKVYLLATRLQTVTLPRGEAFSHRDTVSTAAGEKMKMKTACVTGGSGYIASALIKMLLERGYAVKTTVRNPGSSLI